jgi:uncharacterized protein
MTTAAPTAPKRITTRRVEFEYPEGEIPRHYMDGDLVMSHVVTVLSSLFPEGEDFFVRSVRNYRDKIDDPVLKKQVAGFIGQEAIHGREHRTFNRRLGKMGFPTLVIDRLTAFGLWVLARVLPKKHQLAVTAALEHYTASLAELLLTDEEERAKFKSAEVQSLFTWHALEESEHKAVAFDVYQHVAPGKRGHRIRVGVMNVTTVAFIVATVAGTILSLLLDKTTYNPKRFFGSLRKLRHSKWIAKEMRHRIRDYNRRDFHPNDNDNAELTEQWRTALFGTEGTLNAGLRAAS